MTIHMSVENYHKNVTSMGWVEELDKERCFMLIPGTVNQTTELTEWDILAP